MKRIIGVLLKTILWTAAILLSILIALETVLSTDIPTRIVSRIASDYVDGQIHFGNLSASMFRRFPATTLTLEDFNITYPADRFEQSEKAGAQGHLMYKGCSLQEDTLASFERLSIGINLPALLTGTVSIPYLRLDGPRIFAHSYADGKANWDMFITGSAEEEKDTSETDTGLPKIAIGKVMMTGRPQIVYTDSRDTLFALITLKSLSLDGKIKPHKMHRSRTGLTLDSMFVAGRMGRDTIAAGLDRLYLHEKGRDVNVDAAAKAFLATSSFGRLKIPVNIAGVLSFPEGSVPEIRTKDLEIDILDIPIHLDADVRFDEKTSLAARAYIPETRLTHPSVPEQYLDLGLDVKAETDKAGRLNIALDVLDASIKGAELKASGKVSDALGNDPLISADCSLAADIDSLARFIPDTLGIEAAGGVSVKLLGSANLSQLDIYNFSKSSMTGEIVSDRIRVNMQKDTIDADIRGLHIALGPEDKESLRDSTKTFRLMGISGEVTKADISYKKSAHLKANDFKISAKNIMDDEIQSDTTRKTYPFSGRVSAGKLTLRDTEGTTISLDESNNSFNIFPKKGQPKVPVLTLSSRNRKISLKSGYNRASVSNAEIRASAAMNTVERRQKMKAMRDSLAKAYPGVPKDSLFLHMRTKRGTAAVPEWMKEEDFNRQDIDISLDKSMAKYFRDWDLKGRFSVQSGSVMTPHFPLRNTLQGFDLDFTNDRIAINDFKVRSGDSDISLTGELTGLKRALMGRKETLKLKADIMSDELNANQLLTAYNAGSSFNPATSSITEDASDEEFLESIEADSSQVRNTSSLIVVPANLNADISFYTGNTHYSGLQIDLMTANLTIKERCVQITDTKAHTNMGEIDLEGFYATRSKQDIKTGFSINFKDITAEKVIDLMPSVDTLMPLLKSFGGLLNCEMAVTAGLDTNMNIIMPSINGIMRISGDDLTIRNNDMFKKLARLLLFRNKKEGHIDKMTVEGVIQDSKVEIFPFILEMDRYMLGLSGVQNMDMSYRYHASLIKSPFLIKLGMDIYGPDFDNMKFKLGRAKYKNRNIPVFSSVIDDTKINLVHSIRNIFSKGIDAAIDENRKMDIIEEHKKNIGYVQAVDQTLEELSADEQQQLEAQQAEQEAEQQEEQVNQTENTNE